MAESVVIGNCHVCNKKIMVKDTYYVVKTYSWDEENQMQIEEARLTFCDLFCLADHYKWLMGR